MIFAGLIPALVSVAFGVSVSHAPASILSAGRALNKRQGRNSTSVSVSSTSKILAGRAKRLEDYFASLPSWSRADAQRAYKTLFRVGSKLPTAPGLRVVIDPTQQMFFQPEPYDLWANPKEHPIVGFSALARPEGSIGLDTPYYWNRNTLEFGKEFSAHILVLLSRAMDMLEKRGETLPPVDVTFALWDWCGHFYNKYDPNQLGYYRLPPLLHWNSREGCHTVPVPSYDWEYHHQNFSVGNSWRPDAHASVPWEKRKAQLVWRGNLASWDGSRVRAILTALKFPDILDVRIACKNCQFGQASQDQQSKDGADDVYKNPFCHSLVGAGYGAGRETPKWVLANCSKAYANFLSIEEQMHYKYILDMDGGASSFRVKRDLLTGAVLFRIYHNNSADRNLQFFFEDMEPWVHYVPVDFDTLEEDLPKKVQWAIDHDAEARAIAERAVGFVHTTLREQDALEHLVQTLKHFAKKQDGWTPSAEGEPHLRRFKCEDLLKGAVTGTWTNLDAKMYPSLFGQCMNSTVKLLSPQNSSANHVALGSVVPSSNVLGSVEAANSISSLGGTIGMREEPVPGANLSNFFQTWLEYTPL
eukprot:gnl/MRDRNA2_/MRDRNA2_133125_c0_seq1.p1 gnl/MRDRNA2_/MRDRNA2_133125_c0~~gnl/MRDRNA2_/MRDRNA2_133125_c0_seq1.p1  ORF type:complete len:586 (-),score=95.87 gnl/MRDRNA2_/MRDRNA2_133125_c0_seq1:20-1777(-)